MDGTRRSVLVVDDDPTIRELVEVLLDGEGYEVRTAVHGGEALDVLESWTRDVIVLDMRMPVMDGAAVLTARQASPRLHSIPIIVLSASVKLNHADDGPHAPVLLPKPFRIEELLKHVEVLALRWQLAPA